MSNGSSYKKLVDYVRSLSENRSLLWEVELSRCSKKSIFLAQASRIYIRQTLSISKNSLYDKSNLAGKCQKELIKIDQLLIEEDILVKGVIPSALSLRRDMLKWWKPLSDEDKAKLDIFGNAIMFKKYLKTWRGGKDYQLPQQLGEEFNQELRDLGVLSNEYIKTKDRHKTRDKNFKKKQAEIKAKREHLGALRLETESDLLKPASESPFVQVKQLFAARGSLAASESGKKNYLDGCNHFISFLQQMGVDPFCKLTDILSEYTLIDFKKSYISNALLNKKMASGTALTIFSCVRQTLFRAKAIKQLGFKSFIDVELVVKGRVTETYKPFTLAERNQVTQAIDSDLEEIKELIRPYKKTGIGQSPLDEKGHIIPKMASEDNARYLFENALNCEPVLYNKNNTRIEASFLKIVSKSGSKLHELYQKWGVIAQVNMSILMPFICKLAQVLGMNAEPILNLQLDDFNECHPLTKRPCITYWKERGIGQIDMHLDLFNSELHWLTTKQSRAVWDILNQVKALTKCMREQATDELKNRLFIYQSSGQVKFGEVCSPLGNMHTAYAAFIKKHSLIADNGKPLTFALTRFRPTFVSDLIEAGVSLREIQISLGHKSIQTTVNYLDQMDFNRISRLKLIDALNEIHQSHIKKKNPVNYKYMNNEERIIFQTPLSGCANIFNPPSFVRNSSSYEEGQPCSQYNKCLSCEHVLIAAVHLPTLFALHKHYIHLTESNRVLDTPYGVVILENLSLLDQILTPEESEFTEEELSYAKKISVNIELTNIDSVGA